jgi:carboxyl-terminal processing protease
VGKLVGVKTFGKGLVQTVIPLRDNESAVAISTARYFTPKGHDVNEHGITPDDVVKLDGADIQPLSEKDLQAQAGITLLRAAVAARAQRAEAH